MLYSENNFINNVGAAPWAPISPMIANLYSEHFEKAALSTPPVTAENWLDLRVQQ